jgi:hypothetical protein
MQPNMVCPMCLSIFGVDREVTPVGIGPVTPCEYRIDYSLAKKELI